MRRASVRPCVWLCFTAALSLPAAAAAQVFYPDVDFATGDAPEDLIAADYNGDGLVDVITGNRFGINSYGSLSLFANDGTGLFHDPVVIELPLGGNDLELADLTGDGIGDLVIASIASPRLVVLAGTGFGAFAAPVQYAIPVQGQTLFMQTLEIGDVNKDGWLDVLVCNNNAEPSEQQVSLFLNDGAGGLLAPVEAADGAQAQRALLLHDLNEDGHLDLVVNQFRRLGNGNGAFGPPLATGLTAGSWAIVAGDFNEDGDVDLADVRGDFVEPGFVRIALGNGLGGFAAPMAFGAGTRPRSLVTADFDGDGHLDVAVANAGSSFNDEWGMVTVLHGDGRGGLSAPLEILLSYEGETMDVVSADFDGDGQADIATCQKADDEFSVVLHANTTLAFATPTNFSGTSLCSSVAAGDLDGDGDLDAVMTRSSALGTEQHLVRWLGDGAGGLAAPFGHFVSGPQTDVQLGDFDGDGVLDALAALPTLGSVAQLRGDGLGNFLPATLHAAGDEPVALALADLDGDGDLDAVTANTGSDDLAVLLGDGTGNLGAPASVATGGTTPRALVARDLDGDGTPDLVVANNESYSLAVLSGNGSGGFSAPTLLATPNRPGHVAVGDLDGDGDEDIACAGGGDGSPLRLVVFLRDAGGAYSLLQALPLPIPPLNLDLADLNGDGLLDASFVATNSLRVALGLGGGWLGPPTQAYAPTPGATDAVVADLDGDARKDFLVSQSLGAFCAGVILNTSQPHTWHDLGQGLAGSFGVPLLVGTGPLTTGSSGTLRLNHANKNKLAVLFVAPTSAPAAFKGGVLVPVPPLVSFLLITSAQGQVPLSWPTWTPGVPGSSWYFQYAVVDAAGPAGASLSNALRAVQP